MCELAGHETKNWFEEKKLLASGEVRASAAPHEVDEFGSVRVGGDVLSIC
jgi:hypothetical protein